jgi:hypothetical protein
MLIDLSGSSQFGENRKASMKISYAIEIKSSPEVVFGWLEKPEKAMVWMTSVSKTEILHETTEMVGTTFREVVEEEGGAIEMQGCITGYQSNKSISFHLNSKVNIVDVKYCIEEIREGVRLVEQANIQWKFPINILSMIIGDKIKQNVTAQLRGEFNKLKELCEGDATNERSA